MTAHNGARFNSLAYQKQKSRAKWSTLSFIVLSLQESKYPSRVFFPPCPGRCELFVQVRGESVRGCDIKKLFQGYALPFKRRIQARVQFLFAKKTKQNIVFYDYYCGYTEIEKKNLYYQNYFFHIVVKE